MAGVGLEGVFGCRTYDDFQKISSELQPGVSAVVIGGGVLGLEVASAMIKSKVHVTVLEYAPRLLPKQLSSTASVVLEKMIKNSAGNSIDILCGATVVAIEGAAGKVSAVVLADGRRIPCSVVIVAMGVVPDTRLAQNAGLNVGPRGIVIDSSCRCCGYDEIFACGDCAAFDNFNPGLFAVAQQQGQIVGNNMTGGCAEFTVGDVPVRLPAFGIKMLSIGEIIETDAVESLPEDNAFFRGIYFKDGKCCGAVLLGDLNGQNNIAEMVKNKTEKTVALKEGGLL